MPIIYEDSVLGEPRLGTSVPTSYGDVLTEQFAQTFEENPIKAFTRWNDLREDQRTGPMLDANTARERLKSAGLDTHLKVNDAGITQAALDTLMERKRTELKRQEIFARSTGGVAQLGARFAVSLATTMADPISAGLNFVPYVGQARYARWLASAGSMAGRIGVRAGVGAIEGAIGAGIVEPFIYGMRSQEQADYDAVDSLMNVAMGGVLGAGLHATVGSLGELYTRRTSVSPVDRTEPTLEEAAPRQEPALAPVTSRSEVTAPMKLEGTAARIDALPTDVQQAVLRAAVGQAVTGQAINIEGIVAAVDRSSFENRLRTDPDLRNALAAMKDETGWAERGGQVIRNPETGEVVGRTGWIPRAEWWPERPKGLSEEQIHAAVDKALRGAKLGAREKRVVEFMRDVADQRARLGEYLPNAQELEIEGMRGLDDQYEAALVARASEIDEAQVERLAIQHGDDTDGFLKGIRLLLKDREASQAGTGGPGEAQAVGVTETNTELRDAIRNAEEVLAREPEQKKMSDSEAQLALAEEEAEFAIAQAKLTAKRLGIEFDEEDLAENLAKADKWAQVAEAATVCMTR